VLPLRAALLLFDSVSGLKVNFHKSMLTGIKLTGINISESWLMATTSAMIVE